MFRVNLVKMRLPSEKKARKKKFDEIFETKPKTKTKPKPTKKKN